MLVALMLAPLFHSTSVAGMRIPSWHPVADLA